MIIDVLTETHIAMRAALSLAAVLSITTHPVIDVLHAFAVSGNMFIYTDVKWARGQTRFANSGVVIICSSCGEVGMCAQVRTSSWDLKKEVLLL